MLLGLTSNSTTKAPLEGDNYEIDETYIKVDFSHNGRKFKVIIDQFMYLGVDENGAITVNNIRSQLEAIDRFKSYFLVAVSELIANKKNQQRVFDTMYASFSEEIEKEIINERMTAKEEKKVPMSMYQGITKENIRSRILLHPIYGKKYMESDKVLIEADKNISLVEGLRKDLYERSSNLRQLLKSLDQDRMVELSSKKSEE